MKGRAVIWVLCAAFLAACKPGGDSLEPGSAWDVFKGDKKVLWMKNAPGPILSTAMLPPGAKPTQHKFITATAHDPMEENALGELLGEAKDFAHYVSLLKAKGYKVSPSAGRE